MYRVSIKSHELYIDDIEEFMKDLQKHITEGVIELDVKGEDDSVITYAIYEDTIKEIINDI